MRTRLDAYPVHAKTKGVPSAHPYARWWRPVLGDVSEDRAPPSAGQLSWPMSARHTQGPRIRFHDITLGITIVRDFDEGQQTGRENKKRKRSMGTGTRDGRRVTTLRPSFAK